jgi:hypothetical protein
MIGFLKLGLISLALILFGFCGWWYCLTPQPLRYEDRLVYLQDTFLFHTRNLLHLPTQIMRLVRHAPPSDADVRFWLPSAEAGNRVAQIYVSQHFFAMGATNQAAYVRAVEFLRPAAETGIPIAQNALGVAYQYGYGVEADPVIAYRWFYQSASRGLDLADENLTRLTKTLTPAQLKQAQDRP